MADAPGVDYFRRLGVDRFTSGFAVRWPRRTLALVMATLPALGFIAVVALDLAGARAALDDLRVSEIFARSIGATATVATIAVSVASLTLGRELRGVGGQERHHESNEGFRDRVRRAGGRATIPMGLAPFLSELHRTLAETAERARRDAAADVRSLRSEGVVLDDLLASIASGSRDRAERLRVVGRPHEILVEALGSDVEMWHHLVRGHLRNEQVRGDVRRGLETLEELLRDAAIGAGYAKTLNFQWGLSRMSGFVVVTSFPALLVAFGMVFFYAAPQPGGAWTWPAATLVVASAFAMVLVPFTAFASYLLRFVFLNARTLPTADFVLGPERPRDGHQLYSRPAASSDR